MRNTGTAGFTLVEVLVVISIIAILASIMVPVFITMGRTNKQNTCINNLRQIGIATALYRQDYGVYPPAPRPDYLQSQGKVRDGLPFSDVALVSPAFPQDGQLEGALVAGGYFTGAASTDYLIQIEETADLTATPPRPTDTFKVSTDGGATWDPTTGGRDITLQSQSLGDGVSIRFAADTGHAVGERWMVYAGPQMLPAGWKEWTLETAMLAADAGATEVLLQLDRMPSTLQYAMLSNGEQREVVQLDPNAVVPGPPISIGLIGALQYSYPAGTEVTIGYSYALFDSMADDAGKMALLRSTYRRHGSPPSFPAGNYGLMMLYRLYVDDTRDYLRSFQFYHCPTWRQTEVVDRTGNVTALAPGTEESTDWAPHEAGQYRQVDPLWNGYNSYDVTYNYDQFYNRILAYDYVTGGEVLNLGRQLRNPNPPADTVIAFCFAHREDNAIDSLLASYTTVDQPALTIPMPTNEAEWRDAARQVRYAEQGLRGDQDVVLWLDGSVRFWRPRLVRGRDSDDGKLQYFRQPPFLATFGE